MPKMVKENRTWASFFHLLVYLSGGKTQSQINTRRFVSSGNIILLCSENFWPNPEKKPFDFVEPIFCLSSDRKFFVYRVDHFFQIIPQEVISRRKHTRTPLEMFQF